LKINKENHLDDKGVSLKLLSFSSFTQNRTYQTGQSKSAVLDGEKYFCASALPKSNSQNLIFFFLQLFANYIQNI
jgi:hypothetical protein